MKSPVIFGDAKNFAYEIKDIDNQKFKVCLWCSGKILIPYQKKEKYIFFLENLRKILLDIENNKLMDMDFSLMNEIDIVKWILVSEQDNKLSPNEIYELFNYRRKHSFFLGKQDNISLFIFQLSNDYLGFISMDYRRELTMDELEIINHDNYKFEYCKVNVENFLQASNEIIKFLEMQDSV